VASTCREAVINSRRDIKKALQQFGRKRPDIVLQLPKQLLTDLASAPYPEPLERKAKYAVERLKAETGKTQGGAAVGPTSGRASTQDVVRAMWALVGTATAEDGAATPSSMPGDIVGMFILSLSGSCFPVEE
jgi:hypothetical protein